MLQQVRGLGFVQFVLERGKLRCLSFAGRHGMLMSGDVAKG